MADPASPALQDDDKSDGQYVQFRCLPPGGPLNRWSHALMRGHDFPGAQAMLYGAGVPREEMMKTAANVGMATVWWEGNPCKTRLLDLGKLVKRGVEGQKMMAWQYNAVGVSDAVTMGGQGMRFSLPSRDLIADNIEMVTCAAQDANIAIPGCDKSMRTTSGRPACHGIQDRLTGGKDMPGVVMAVARHNRPFMMIYGGSIRKGHSALLE